MNYHEIRAANPQPGLLVQDTLEGSTITPMRVLAVIVLYGTTLEECVSYRSLRQAEAGTGKSELDLSVLVYDNTPGRQHPEATHDGVIYYVSPRNSGLAEAFNHAIAIAHSKAHEWLLTLDQDTTLPTDFLSSLVRIARQVREQPRVAAIVPELRDQGTRLSPHSLTSWGASRRFPDGFSGLSEIPVYAFNSASLLRVSALLQMGGYDPRFWLDYSDYSAFRRLAQYGKAVYVAGEVQVEHHFSGHRVKTSVSAGRYANHMSAECAFVDLDLGTLASIRYTLLVAARWLKRVARRDPPEMRRTTMQLVKKRLFESRKRRIAEWKEETAERLSPETSNPPKVSVCMATYNGARYLAAQMDSILSQLGPDDELVIVDDGSTDDTKKIIQCYVGNCGGSYGAGNIRLIEHASNQGVVASFEEAVRSASGDIIFLSDQDDIWLPGRVGRVLDAFASSEVSLVCTEVQRIDENGRLLAESEAPRKFDRRLLQNLIANRFQGSAMAFRSSLLRDILPFPKKYFVLHDAWIGARCALAGHKVAYIEEPLMYYRRHSQNVSARLPVGLQIKKRVHLIVALGEFAIRRRIGSEC